MLDRHFWENRYKEKQTGWDIGHISHPLKLFINKLKNKEQSILIPGCGHAYEAEYLHLNGFKNVSIVDLSEIALNNFKKRVPDFPSNKIFNQNFFEHNLKYDLIIEQTFFCALDPDLRKKYVSHCKSILNENGFICGLLFDFDFKNDHPPFGSTLKEYKDLFETEFKILQLELSPNSIEARKGKELFFRFQNLDSLT
ncbi:MAG: SAM-dependent methyltransferase [Flavobacteriales bacterium]